MMIDAFYIIYIAYPDFASCNNSSVTREQHPSTCGQHLSCIDRLNNLMLSIETGRIDFAMIYARQRSYVGAPWGELSVSSIVKQMGLAICKEPKPEKKYVLLKDGDTIINVAPFASWGMTSPETLRQLIKVVRQQNIRYIFVRWPCHIIEVGQDVIHFVFPLPPRLKGGGIKDNSREIIRLLMNTEETQQYISALWPDFEEQTKDSEGRFYLGNTYIEL